MYKDKSKQLSHNLYKDLPQKVSVSDFPTVTFTPPYVCLSGFSTILNLVSVRGK